MKTEQTDSWLDSRLPRRHLITVPEVVSALEVSAEVVTGWIEAGEVEGVDVGAGGKAYWKIVRSSFFAFWERRKLGIREPATATLKKQSELFPNTKQREIKQ